jgi:hypothetical protein
MEASTAIHLAYLLSYPSEWKNTLKLEPEIGTQTMMKAMEVVVVLRLTAFNSMTDSCDNRFPARGFLVRCHGIDTSDARDIPKNIVVVVDDSTNSHACILLQLCAPSSWKDELESSPG